MTFEQRKIPVAIIGLESSGKSTFAYRLKTGQFPLQSLKPTQGMNVVRHIDAQNLVLQLFDLGGQRAFRNSLWRKFVQLSEGIIFVFDSADREKLKESKEWFWKVFEWAKESSTILFLANKSDLPCLTLQEIIMGFDIINLPSKQTVSFHIFQISLKTGDSFEDAIDWLKQRLFTMATRQELDLDGIMFFNEEGDLIRAYSYSTQLDEDFSSFLIAFMQDAINTSFDIEDERIDAMVIDNFKIVIVRRSGFYVVLIGSIRNRAALLRLCGESMLSSTKILSNIPTLTLKQISSFFSKSLHIEIV